MEGSLKFWGGLVSETGLAMVFVFSSLERYECENQHFDASVKESAIFVSQGQSTSSSELAPAMVNSLRLR